MDSDFVVGINKSIDAAKGETGKTYPAYLHNTLVTEKLDELAEAITEGGGGASALSDLEDVDISGTVQGGKVLKYNAVEEKWAPGDDSGNVQSDWNENDPSSGAYILNKPTIPAAQVQSDWDESDTTDPSYIKNKPDISNIINGTTDPSINIGDNGDIYLKKELTISQEQIDINYSHANDGTTTTITVSENNTVIYTNTVNNVQQGDLDERYAGFDEVTANVTSLGGVTFIFKYRGVAVNASHSTCFFTSFNDGEETGWTMNGNSSFPHNETKTFNVPSGFIVSEIFLKDNNKWITYKQDQVQADWNESDSSDPSYIQNKPTIPDVSTKMDKANPTGTGSFSLNRKANTTIATNSFAEGRETTASGDSSHAEGSVTIASANSAHAEGAQTTASGTVAHAEGSTTTASGDCSHAEGYLAIASGDCSHAGGNGTIAQRKSQHVFGENNIADTTGADGTVKGTYIEIVGNGTADNARSNARTLDWSGNESLAGNIDAAGFGSRLAALVPSDLDDLSDVDLTNLQNGMTLKYNSGTLKFEAGVLYIEILQADYDQLSYAQKHNGIPYFITDGQGAAALPSYVDLTDILTAGNTTLTIQSQYITTAGTYDIYTDPEVPYNSKVVTAGQIVITFDEQSSDLAVKVRIT